MSQPLPTLQTTTLSVPQYRKYGIKPGELGPEVILDSGLSDSGSTPTFRIRPGNCVVKKTSSGTYVAANDATGDRCGPASVSALEAASAAWNSLAITFTVDGGVPFSVTLQAGTGTNAAAVTDLNNNAIFAANCIADVSGGFVRIRTNPGGEGATLLVNAASRAAAFGANGTGGQGTDADYVVTEDFGDTKDLNAAAVNVSVPASKCGSFVAANIINLTSEARAVLTRRGSKWY